MNQSYMKEHPVMKLLLTMSLPMMISMLVNSLYNIVDSFFVAKISEDAMTALSLVFPMQNLVNAVMVGFGIGINAMISFYMGANDRKMVDKAASQGMLLGTLHGVVLTVVCILFITPFLRMFTSSEQVVELGSSYSVIAFSFSVILAWELVFEKTFQAVGRMAVSMVCMMSGCIANIILDPLLIFGIGPFPLLGIQGAALATGLGQTISAVFYLIIYLTRPMSVHFHRKDAILDTTLCKKMYSIGIPATLNMALPSLLISALNMILAGFSQTYVFVLGVYYKLQTFLYLPANGVIQGMRPLIGYNYGAGEKKRVHQIFLQESGKMPKFSLCDDGIAWFQSKGKWKSRGYSPAPGTLIFFDWNGDGTSDHVGIVEKTEGSTVYTVEGNSSDAVNQRSYDINNGTIMGYGIL